MVNAPFVTFYFYILFSMFFFLCMFLCFNYMVFLYFVMWPSVFVQTPNFSKLFQVSNSNSFNVASNSLMSCRIRGLTKFFYLILIPTSRRNFVFKCKNNELFSFATKGSHIPYVNHFLANCV